jgi:hypothetical protein
LADAAVPAPESAPRDPRARELSKQMGHDALRRVATRTKTHSSVHENRGPLAAAHWRCDVHGAVAAAMPAAGNAAMAFAAPPPRLPERAGRAAQWLVGAPSSARARSVGRHRARSGPHTKQERVGVSQPARGSSLPHEPRVISCNEPLASLGGSLTSASGFPVKSIRA